MSMCAAGITRLILCERHISLTCVDIYLNRCTWDTEIQNSHTFLYIHWCTWDQSQYINPKQQLAILNSEVLDRYFNSPVVVHTRKSPRSLDAGYMYYDSDSINWFNTIFSAIIIYDNMNSKDQDYLTGLAIATITTSLQETKPEI